MIKLALESHPWAVVLAGGDGLRLERFVFSRFGARTPKQFCAFTGTRSMFEHTLDRASMGVERSRIFAVITQNHLQFAEKQLRKVDPRNVIVQPAQRDTAPGLLLALHRVLMEEPGAVVIVFPSDHFIVQEEVFMQEVDHAHNYVAAHPEIIVLLGAEPTAPEPSYGWIEQGNTLANVNGRGISSVKSFREKPDPVTAATLHEKGCLWNTMVIVGRADRLLKHFRQTVPDLCATFETLSRSMRGSLEIEEVRRVFDRIPQINFSTAVLEHIPHHLAVLKIDGVYWSDWGDENRIRADCLRFDLQLNGGVAAGKVGFAAA
jgi:mannose-1-phosphate guanylyltransferase